VIYLYAFTTGLRRLPDVGGIGGSVLKSRRFGDVEAIISNIDDLGDASEDALRHGLVVEALVECADGVLPVRFGEGFSNDEALADAVAPKQQPLAEQLRRVSGCVEIGVRMLTAENADDPVAADGTDYMRQKLGSVTADEAIVGELHGTLSKHARDTAVGLAGALPHRHDVGYLVARTDVHRFAAEVERFVDLHPDVTVLCTGPWAPYSFGSAA
jgi:hypothetical protein